MSAAALSAHGTEEAQGEWVSSKGGANSMIGTGNASMHAPDRRKGTDESVLMRQKIPRFGAKDGYLEGLGTSLAELRAETLSSCMRTPRFAAAALCRSDHEKDVLAGPVISRCCLEARSLRFAD